MQIKLRNTRELRRHDYCRWAILVFASAAIFCVTGVRVAAAGQPDFGPNVLIFDPSTPDIQQQVDAVAAKQEHSEFGAGRYAFLFKQGQYHLDVRTGYYTQVIGLGELPDDVTITGAVRSKAALSDGNATCNFWRAAENLAIVPKDIDGGINVWAVSQSTALRRVHVKGNLVLSDHGWSSGGFIADSKIDGTVDPGSQQQWLSRNADWGQWKNNHGNWNFVFVGDGHVPAGSFPQDPYTSIAEAPLTREKPYLILNTDGQYYVRIPNRQLNSHGTTWEKGRAPDTVWRPINEFYIAHPTDTAQSINNALSIGFGLILTPGIYHLDQPLHVTHANAVVMGLGYATLVAERGTAALQIDDVDGVSVSGLILEAGPTASANLLEVGPPGSKADHSANPTFVYDLCCRAGGPGIGKADRFVTVNSNNVVGDNWWLWRADHGDGVGWTQNTVANGLVVNSDDVTFYGLFVEHCQAYQTLWNGQRGRTYFYQSEMPYDPPSQSAWTHDGVRGYASYKLADSVKSHEAWGVGVYCVFVDGPVVADTAIETPAALESHFHDLTTLRFGGVAGSGIEHVLNGRGTAVIDTQSARLR